MEVTKSRRQQPSMPRELRKEITQCARAIAKNYTHVFNGDHTVKDKVLRLFRALLPPRPRRRGRPPNTHTTRTLLLYRKFRRKFPEEKSRTTWSRIYPLVIPGYEDMSDREQRTARDELRERVSWRRRRKARKIAAQFSV